MRLRTAVGMAVVGGAAIGGGRIALRRLERRVTAQLNDVDLSGAPLGPPIGTPRGTPVSGTARVAPPPWEPPLLSALAEWQPASHTRPLARLAAYVWAGPMTLAGLLAGAASGAPPTLRDGVLLFADASGPMGSWLRFRGFRGTALGHVVITRDQPDDILLAHELMHVRQAERFGPLFAPVYLALMAVYGYARHPMERAARKAARIHAGAPS